MSTDVSHLVGLDPSLAVHGISVPAYRLTVEEPDSSGDRWWRFAGKIQTEEDTPSFGLALLLLDELGLPLETEHLSFTRTIDPRVYVVEGTNWRLKEIPAEAQLVLEWK